ncbi:MAG: hypothetical protein RR190_02190, partial [Bacteroidales bacterium]
MQGAGIFIAADTASYTIKAEAPAAYYFLHWVKASTYEEIKENPYTLIKSGHLTSDEQYIATFAESVYTLQGTQLHGQVNGYGNYKYGQIAQLQAIPDSGYAFVKWTNAKGESLSTKAKLDVNMSTDLVYNAVFALRSYKISTSVLLNGAKGSVDPVLNQIAFDHF